MFIALWSLCITTCILLMISETTQQAEAPTDALSSPTQQRDVCQTRTKQAGTARQSNV